MTPHLARAAAWSLGVTLLLTACGEAGLLDGLGARSQDVVYEDTTTTTTVLIETASDREVGAVAAVDVEWFNDVIERQFQGEPSYVIQKVWQRRTGETRFIQASRLEITQALPNIRFPSLVPDEVGWVTSQLVYDTVAATLDADTAVAFGLWALEPYTVTDGRVAVLRVGVARPEQQEAPSQIIADVVDEGISLNWVTGDFRYELFCRTSLPEDLCWQMAEMNSLLVGQLRGADTAQAASAGG
ncbi:MAG: hypothetical protein ACE5GC_02445 [Acidimicrobiia bacterium]